MRIVFVGRQTFANHCFANWLARRHDLVAVFRADVQRHTAGYQLRWVKRRLKRDGLLRTVDQILYYLYYTLFQKRLDEHSMRQAFAAVFGHEALGPPAGVPVYEFADLNSEEAISTLAELQPDLAFAACISQHLRRPYREIPRYGTVLYHEGLTPEYKGVHTAFWANLRGEVDRIGYTLLQLTEGIDAGKPVAQGVGKIDPERAYLSGYAGHKALIDGLPDVERALAAIEAGEQITVDRAPGPAEMFTYPGLSNELRRIWRRRQQWRETVPL
jgi:methionyl-tRNA formyltransferase